MGFSSALKYALARLKCPDLELKDKQKEAIAISNLLNLTKSILDYSRMRRQCVPGRLFAPRRPGYEARPPYDPEVPLPVRGPEQRFTLIP